MRTITTILATSTIYLAVAVYLLASDKMEIAMGGLDEEYVIASMKGE